MTLRGPSPDVPLASILLSLPPRSPTFRERLSAVGRRLAAAPAHPVAALWCYRSGEPLAELVLPGQEAPDAADLAGVWRAFDHVLSTEFGWDRGAPGALQHGDYTFVFESGRYLTLAVLLKGTPSGGLRSQLRSAVRGFEAEHENGLATLDDAMRLAEPALVVLDDVLNPRGP